MPKVSVIIPCYNQGHYLDEAVDSVLAGIFQDFEIVVVNDGSTDAATNTLLASYAKPRTRVVTTANQGLALARNAGILASHGEYLLPLDADDKIGPEYLAEAVPVLDANPDIGIVYGEAEYFGAWSGRWALQPYSFESLLKFNMIFCTSLFRRADFDKTSGYNPNMTYGWEDWDLWLSLHELGLRAHKLPDVHFFYRIRPESMVRALSDEQKAALRKQVYLNHLTFYLEHFPDPVNLTDKKERLEERLTEKEIHCAQLLAEVLEQMTRLSCQGDFLPSRKVPPLSIDTPSWLTSRNVSGMCDGLTEKSDRRELAPMNHGERLSPGQSFLSYIGKRSRNALETLKARGLPGVFENVMSEIEWKVVRPLRQAIPRRWRFIQDSAFCNRRKVFPRRARPTRDALMPTPALSVEGEVLRQALQRLQEELRGVKAIRGKIRRGES